MRKTARQAGVRLSFIILLILAWVTAATAQDFRDLARADIKDPSGKVVTRYGDSYALLIGVSKYTLPWPNLDSVPDELDKIEAALKGQGFKKVVRVIDPTGAQLLAAFEAFVNEFGYEKSNRLLIFFSGHGETLGEGDGFLVPSDAPSPLGDGEEAFRKVAIDMIRIIGYGKLMTANHVLFLFDSCFSGSIFQLRAAPKRPPIIDALIGRPARVFITSGSAKERVPAKSTFAPLFVDALNYGRADLNGDGYTTGTELGMYLQAEVVNNAEHAQTPQFGTMRDVRYSVGDFVFVAPNSSLIDEPATPVSAPRKPTAPAQQLAMLDRAYLTIEAKPRNAHIRIANIGSPYRAGIELAPGDYEVEITAEGYEPHHALYRVDSGNRSITVQLKAKPKGRQAGEVFRDRLDSGGEGPEMVVIPAGSFDMGSKNGDADETPVHRVTIGKPFALGRHEVTVADFRRFVQATNYTTDAERDEGGNKGCFTISADLSDVGYRAGTSWENPGIEQKEDHPVVCVSHTDVAEYITWISAQTGKAYGLPSEAKWEYAARGATRPTKTSRYWGDKDEDACRYANVVNKEQFGSGAFDCRDGYKFTAPVGSYVANNFGLKDMLGNVWEWTADCWHENYDDAPKDGSVWKGGDCGRRVVRGGSWNFKPAWVRSAIRDWNDTANRSNSPGFRLAQDL